MRKRISAALAAALLTSAGVQAAQSGPPAGAGAPMLEVDAVNDQTGRYCITCEAGQEPLVIAFVKANDDVAKRLIQAVAAQHRAHAQHGLHAAVVFVGGPEAFANLARWAREQRIVVPLARVPAGAEALQSWHLNAQVKTTTVLCRGHRVHASVADLDPATLGNRVGQILGGDGHPHH